MAIDEAIEVYQIETSLTTSIDYDPELGKVGFYERGAVRIGSEAFDSPGYLGSSIAHEAELHGLQYFEGRLAQSGTTGRALNEAEAYRYEAANGNRFGLSPSEFRSVTSSALKFEHFAVSNGAAAQVANGSYVASPSDLYPPSYYNKLW